VEGFFVWIFFSFLIALLAHARGRSGIGFFFLSAVLSPLIGLIAVLVVKNLKEEEQLELMRKEDHERQLASIRTISSSRQETSASVRSSVADELEKLARLRERGILTESSFKNRRR
jgi:hypothetical protein